LDQEHEPQPQTGMGLATRETARASSVSNDRRIPSPYWLGIANRHTHRRHLFQDRLDDDEDARGRRQRHGVRLRLADGENSQPAMINSKTPTASGQQRRSRADAQQRP
jgi:hypothetical protein